MIWKKLKSKNIIFYLELIIKYILIVIIKNTQFFILLLKSILKIKINNNTNNVIINKL